MTQEALNRIAEKLRRAGASLPAPEVTGTIEGSIVTGLCIALALVESEIEALAQPEQEPVAWVAEAVCDGQYIDGRPRKIWWECKKGVGTAFYTTPPQRTWVGLTDEEAQQTFAKHNCTISTHLAGILARAIEAKLKEKNT